MKLSSNSLASPGRAIGRENCDNNSHHGQKEGEVTLQMRSNYRSLYCRKVWEYLEDQDNSGDRKDGSTDGTPLWFGEGLKFLGFTHIMKDDEPRTGRETLFMWVRCRPKI